MVTNKKRRRIICLVVIMILSVLLRSEAYAAKKVKLSSKIISLKVGQEKTLKLKNNKRKVKWSVVSGKKVVKLSAKKKTRVTIKGKKKGTAKVQAKIGKKKYTCKVVVKQPKKSVKKSSEEKTVKQSEKPTKLPTEEPVNTPDTQPEKKVISISYANGRKYAFLEKGKRLVDTGNTGIGLEPGDVEIGHFIDDELEVKYTDGTTENWGSGIASYDFSQINFDKVGVYDIILTYKGCTCKVPVIISERKTEGLYTYLTDGNIAELVEMDGDRKVEDEDSDYDEDEDSDYDDEDSDYNYEFTSTTLEIPETLGGAKVVQGLPLCNFSTEKIKTVKFPQYYQESYSSVASYFGYGFLQLEEFVVDEENHYYTAKDNVLFAENGKVLCVYPNGLKATSYQIPEGVIKGGGSADRDVFVYNPYLTEITFPKSYVGVQTYGGWFYYNRLNSSILPNLKKINVADDNPYWSAIDGVLYRKAGGNTLSLFSYPAQKRDKSFIVEGNVVNIAEIGLYNEYLEDITFKTGQTDMAAFALNGEHIKNIYCDFEECDEECDIGTFITYNTFCGDEDLFDFRIHIRNKKFLEHIHERWHSKVLYY